MGLKYQYRFAMLQKRVLRFAYRYILDVSKSKPYNVQSQAILSYFKNNPLRMTKKNIDFYTGIFKREYLDRYCDNVRDFVYKTDYFTPREMYLMHPIMYLYYTCQVFLILIATKGIYGSFNKSNLQIFYSGKIAINKFENIKIDSRYNNSYNSFQECKARYEGYRVFKVDIQDCFKNIRNNDLERELNKLGCQAKFDINPYISNLMCILKYSNYSSLPQLNNSVASSALSQLYLDDFDDNLNSVLENSGCQAIRFVDDMYVKVPKKFSNSQIHELIGDISSELWKLGLNLNIKKIRIFSINQFKKSVNYLYEYSDSFPEEIKFIGQKYVGDKVNELLEHQGYLLLNFFKEVEALNRHHGVDLTGYLILFDKYFNVRNEGGNKTLSNLIYSRQWQNLPKSVLGALLKHNKIIFFDPAKFVPFLLMIEQYLVLRNKPVEKFIKNINISNLNFTIREGSIDASYFGQRRPISRNMLVNMKDLNIKYIIFINTFYQGKII